MASYSNFKNPASRLSQYGNDEILTWPPFPCSSSIKRTLSALHFHRKIDSWCTFASYISYEEQANHLLRFDDDEPVSWLHSQFDMRFNRALLLEKWAANCQLLAQYTFISELQ
jgi:hypothetical protein